MANMRTELPWRGRLGRFVQADSSDFWPLGSKIPKMGDFLHWTPMNRRAKFDATSFILGGEIRNSTNKQTQTHK